MSNGKRLLSLMASELIDELLKQNLITHLRQLDVLRIWQSSNFNFDKDLNKLGYINLEVDNVVGYWV
jgi:hypothetical protein